MAARGAAKAAEIAAAARAAAERAAAQAAHKAETSQPVIANAAAASEPAPASNAASTAAAAAAEAPTAASPTVASVSWPSPNAAATALAPKTAATAAARPPMQAKVSPLTKASGPKSSAGTKALAAPKVVVASMTVAIEDVSLAEDSGWREIDQARVAELRQSFEGGQYGMNLLKKPSLLQESGQRLTCKDTLLKLADGKHTFQALSDIKKHYDSLAENQRECQGYTHHLIQALTVGVDVSVLEFEEWDDDVTLAWAVTIHDTESNKYKPTSLKDMVSVATRYKSKVPGGSWSGTQALLESVYGKSRRMFVFRMVKAAQSVSPCVCSSGWLRRRSQTRGFTRTVFSCPMRPRLTKS